MKGIAIILISISCQPLLAQSYEIKLQSQRINNVKYDGYSSKVNAATNEVEDFWLDYLKANGKVRRKRNYYQITEFKTTKFKLDSLTLLTRVSDVDSLGVVWIGIKNKLDDTSKSDHLESLNKVLKKFTKAFYLSQQQKKIDASEQAAIFVSKNHEKLIREAEDLRLELNSAEGYKLRLEEQLANTILQIKVLNQKILDNKAATEQAYQDLQKINKVTEQNKADLKKIN
jgi:hypothetical protein